MDKKHARVKLLTQQLDADVFHVTVVQKYIPQFGNKHRDGEQL